MFGLVDDESMEEHGKHSKGAPREDAGRSGGGLDSRKKEEWRKLL